MIELLCFSAVCIGAFFLYTDSSAKKACLASALFFYVAAVVSRLPDYNSEIFAFFCLNLALMWYIKDRAHYLLCFVCASGLTVHALGYAVFKGYIGNYLPVYNNAIMIVNYSFIFLILAQSDAGLRRIAQGRYILKRLLDRLEVGL